MSTARPADACADRVRLPFAFDAAAMLDDLPRPALQDFLYHDVMPLRSPARLVDPGRAAAARG